MTVRASRSLVALLALAVFGAWAWIVWIAGDPETGWGAAWFELALTNFAVTFLAAWACYVLWQPSAWRPRLARATLSTAAILLAAALIELPALLGLVDYRRVLVPRCLGGNGPHNRQLDPELVYRHLPHDHFVHQQVGDSAAGLAIPGARRYCAEVQCDANGFRNSKDFRRADVVLLGDSFVEGYNVTQDAIGAKHLADRLSAEVCNLALCGFGPQQELAALKRYGVPLQPQAVVWFFYEGNDLEDIDDYERVMGRWKRYEAEEQGYAARSFFLNVLDPLAFWLDQRRWRPSELARRRAGRLRPEIPGNGRNDLVRPPAAGDRRTCPLRASASWKRSSRRPARPARRPGPSCSWPTCRGRSASTRSFAPSMPTARCRTIRTTTCPSGSPPGAPRRRSSISIRLPP